MMGGLTSRSLLTDALLLDALDGIESIASRLIELFDRWGAVGGHSEDAAVVATVLTDLGWWSGRLHGAISPETVNGLSEVVSGGY